MNRNTITEILKAIAIRVVAITLVGGVVVGSLYATYRYVGLLNTIVYTLLFLATVTLAPLTINLAGNGVPFNGPLGRGHIVLGAFAYGHHYLVQRDGNRWEWCPGTQTHVYIDAEWHEIAGGHENKSVLGWRPFGILRYKTNDTYQDVRVDNKALKDTGRDETIADGGGVMRGSFTETNRPTVSGHGSRWLVDLKRLWSSGVQKIGDIAIIETAEEIIERGQVNDNTITGNPTVTFFVALVLGVVVGFVYVYLMAP